MSESEESVKDALLELLHSIQRGDVDAYRAVVSKTLTCYEPETHGHRVDGVDLHVFLTEGLESPKRYHLELVEPVIRVYGESAYAAYTLIVTRQTAAGTTIEATNETRVFAREGGRWKMVHFHRSKLPSGS